MTLPLLILAVIFATTLGVESKPPPCPQVKQFSELGFPLEPQLKYQPLSVLGVAEADPCPGNALVLAPANIAVIDNGTIRVFQHTGGNNFNHVWVEETKMTYYDVRIGDVDADGQMEIVGMTSVALHALFHVYEEGSKGFPQDISESSVVSRSAWSADTLIGDVDGDGRDEVVALISNHIAVFGYTPGQGYRVEFESGPHEVILNDGDLGDVDQDGILEIVSGTTDRSGNKAIWVWDYQEDGTWTHTISDPALWPKPSYYPIFGTKVGDIDGDGLLEIVSLTSSPAIPSTNETFISVWEYEEGEYRITSTQTFTFEDLDQTKGTSFDVADLDGDGRAELVVSGYGPVPKLFVLSFDGRSWTRMWTGLSHGVVNELMVGDADGNPATVEIVLVGVASRPTEEIRLRLYLEVFRWTSEGAVSIWRLSDQFYEGWDAHLG